MEIKQGCFKLVPHLWNQTKQLSVSVRINIDDSIWCSFTNSRDRYVVERALEMRRQVTHLWYTSPVLLINTLSLFLFLDLQVGKRFFFFSLGLVGSESGNEVISLGLDGKVMTEPPRLVWSSSGEVPHWPSVLSASLCSLSELFDFPNSFLILDFDTLMIEYLRHVQRWSFPLVLRSS